jgi:hypothetical protein
LNKRSRLGGIKPGGGHQGCKIKGVGSKQGGAEKLLEEGMEDRRFGIMREDRIGILIIEDLDLIFLKMTQGTEVEIAGIFVVKSDIFNFCPLSPVGSSLIVFPAKVRFGKRPEQSLKGGKVTSLLKMI